MRFVFLSLAAVLILGFVIFLNLADSSRADVTLQVQVTSLSPTPTPTESPTSTPTLQPGGGGGGGGVPLPRPAIVEFKGLAYPNAVVNILRDGQLISTVAADYGGFFAFSDSGLAGGNYNFGFIATDTEGRKSTSYSFVLNVAIESITSVSGIVMPPTISIESSQLSLSDKLAVSGQATPGSAVTIEVLPEELVYQTAVASNGTYFVKTAVRNLEIGMHTVRSRVKLRTGEESIFSEVIIFGLGVPYKERKFEIPGAGITKMPDFNGDGRVNIVDVSIMIFWYKKTVPAGFFSDLNNDGIVDIADFSILVFYWTG